MPKPLFDKSDLSNKTHSSTLKKLLSQLQNSQALAVSGNPSMFCNIRSIRIPTFKYSKAEVLAITNTPVCKELVSNSSYVSEVYNSSSQEKSLVYIVGEDMRKKQARTIISYRLESKRNKGKKPRLYKSIITSEEYFEIINNLLELTNAEWLKQTFPNWKSIIKGVLEKKR
jgi:endo-alpha-1,4-polygalactosaminidase (GH114 family)